MGATTQVIAMGCGGSEEQEQEAVHVEDEDDCDDGKVGIDLYIEKANASGSFAKQTVMCDPKMLFIGLIPTAITLGQEHGGWNPKAHELWEKITMITSADGAAVFPDRHATLDSLAACKSPGWNNAILVFNRTDNKKDCCDLNDEENKCAAETVAGLPGSAGDVTECDQKDLGIKEGQLQVQVFAAVPAKADGEEFAAAGSGCPEEGSTVMYQVNFWTTRKIIVGAIRDAANEGFHHLIPGADFKMVTSYVLGEKPEVNKPTPGYTLLNFEASDEIEDLDGFEEHMDRLSFMVYNEAEDKPACNLHNFWALEPMMTEYDDVHGHAADSKKCITHRVPKANCIEHEVTDWVKLQTDARAKADE